MTPQRPVVVVNPTKVADRADLTRTVTRALTAAGIPEPTWYDTTADDPGRGQTRAALADGADLVLVYGGDGTVRACVAELAGTEVPLAVLPAGTGNLLARNLAIPTHLRDAARVAAGGAHRRIDVAELDGETFVVIAGIGFDAQLFEHTSDKLKGRLGWGAYLAAGVKTVRDAECMPILLELDGDERTVDGIGVLIGNLGTLQGGIELLDEASPDNGLLDVGILGPTSVRDWVGLGTRLARGRRPRPWQLEQFTAREVTVSLPRELPTEADGDLLDHRAVLRARVRPAALTVCVPADGRR